MTIRIGTRGSQLATTQSGAVAHAITAITGTPTELVAIRSEGDVNRASLSSLGGIGVFAAALRIAVLEGEVDAAVHSLKDLPTAPAPGLSIVAIPEREDVRDALCARDGLTLETLPHGARVGTGSPRRAAQLLARRPDLSIVDLRGNVPTRLGRVAAGDLDAVVLAASGLRRLGLTDAITDLLDADHLLPAPGQGALAVEARSDADASVLATLAVLDHHATRMAVTAERCVLAQMNAGCATPVGALAQVSPRRLTLQASSTAPGGVTSVSATEQIELTGDPQHVRQDLAAAEEAGRRAGRTLLAGGAARFEGATEVRREVLDAGSADDITSPAQGA